MSFIGPRASSSLLIVNQAGRAGDHVEFSVDAEVEFIANLGVFMSKVAIHPGAVGGWLGRLCKSKEIQTTCHCGEVYSYSTYFDMRMRTFSDEVIFLTLESFLNPKTYLLKYCKIYLFKGFKNFLLKILLTLFF